MNHTLFRNVALSLLLAALLIIFAAQVDAQENNDQSRLSTEQVRNIFLQADGMGGGIQMVDGVGQELNADEEIIANYQILNPIALGDLNNDDAGDAAILLSVAPVDGSSVFYSVHVLLNNEGEPNTVAFAVLENAARILNFTIRDGQIIVDMIVRGEDDPDCCPASTLRQIYKLQDSGAFDLVEELSFEDAELPFAFDDELTHNELANLTYPETLDFSTIDLVDGEYSYSLGDHTFNYQLVYNVVFGDLTGDGLDDAAVLLQYSFDGEPAIQHMYVVLNDRGMPFIAGWRDYSRSADVEIQNIAIEDQELTVEFLDTVHDNLLTETMVIEMEALVTK